DRQVERLSRQIPECRLYRGENGYKHTRLRAFEESAPADVFKQPMNVERASASDASAEHLYELIGAWRCVNTLAATPYVLVGIDLHEEAMPATNVAALNIGDLKITWCRHFRRPVDGIFKAFSASCER